MKSKKKALNTYYFMETDKNGKIVEDYVLTGTGNTVAEAAIKAVKSLLGSTYDTGQARYLVRINFAESYKANTEIAVEEVIFV